MAAGDGYAYKVAPGAPASQRLREPDAVVSHRSAATVLGLGLVGVVSEDGVQREGEVHAEGRESNIVGVQAGRVPAAVALSVAAAISRKAGPRHSRSKARPAVGFENSATPSKGTISATMRDISVWRTNVRSDVT